MPKSASDFVNDFRSENIEKTRSTSEVAAQTDANRHSLVVHTFTPSHFLTFNPTVRTSNEP